MVYDFANFFCFNSYFLNFLAVSAKVFAKKTKTQFHKFVITMDKKEKKNASN